MTRCPILAAGAAAQGIPAQVFTLDPAHGSVTFGVSHPGLSQFTAGFDTLSATLTLDPDDPDAAELEAEILVSSLDLPTPPLGLRVALMAPLWFDADAHPTITCRSDAITRTGDDAAQIEGTLTINGIDRPVRLTVTYNAGYPAGLFEPHARIGFSAETDTRRSEFGLTEGIPGAGSELGVGDSVRIRIEAEFTGTAAD
ncbi:Polyisoprenoid-binding protein YceI [Cribrihabitans marinus]|uniref:Polyisoprenoid-binding protein YceI n=1 Tax=Cribrihabitans marinus TaxID=1227549 RepID=A0A1H6QZG9_9RHOB|nr:YceI family protein [Cribrihabitans marinus]GGH19360.1 polyisoprenoid-binding protein [Cribrihabitans marinus]SEI44850.1 Polyisoprenoid-binding protein YceI [Cribrihabitans marinus]